MIEKLTLHRAYCDECKRRYDIVAPKSVLKTHLEMNGWRVSKDAVTCPDCIAKGAEEYGDRCYNGLLDKFRE